MLKFFKSGNFKIIVGGFVVLVTILAFNVLSSPQLVIYNLNKAVASDNFDAFNKYYAVALPGASDSSSEADKKKAAYDKFKADYYQKLSLWQSFMLKITNESTSKGTVNSGILIYSKDSGQTVVYRLVRGNSGWLVVDIAKIKS